MQRIVGIDASLTSMGLASIELVGGRLNRPSARHHGRKGKRGETLLQRHERIDRLATTAADYALDPICPATFVGIESHDFDGVGGSQHDRSGLWWIIVDRLLSAPRPPAIVLISPSQIKMFATGNGGSQTKKADVHRAAEQAFPLTEFAVDDEADAAWAASIVARRLYDLGIARGGVAGHLTRDPQRTRALDKIDWPEGLR